MVGLLARQVAEWCPALSVESDKLKLPDGKVRGGTGCELDTGKKERKRHPFHVGCLAHDVFARQIVPALLQT